MTQIQVRPRQNTNALTLSNDFCLNLHVFGNIPAVYILLYILCNATQLPLLTLQMCLCICVFMQLYLCRQHPHTYPPLCNTSVYYTPFYIFGNYSIVYILLCATPLCKHLVEIKPALLSNQTLSLLPGKLPSAYVCIEIFVKYSHKYF